MREEVQSQVRDSARRPLQSPRLPKMRSLCYYNIGVGIITNIIPLGFLYHYTILTPQNPGLIIKAPILGMFPILGSPVVPVVPFFLFGSRFRYKVATKPKKGALFNMVTGLPSITVGPKPQPNRLADLHISLCVVRFLCC